MRKLAAVAAIVTLGACGTNNHPPAGADGPPGVPPLVTGRGVLGVGYFRGDGRAPEPARGAAAAAPTDSQPAPAARSPSHGHGWP